MKFDKRIHKPKKTHPWKQSFKLSKNGDEDISALLSLKKITIRKGNKNEKVSSRT